MIDITQHYGLVYSIVNKFKLNSWVFNDKDDLIQEGMLGLIEAGKRYNPDFNNTFSTYAYSYIEGYIKNYLNKCQHNVSLSEPVYEDVELIDTIESKIDIENDIIEQDLLKYRRHKVKIALTAIPTKDAELYKMYMENCDVHLIKDVLGLSGSKVDQVIKKVERYLSLLI